MPQDEKLDAAIAELMGQIDAHGAAVGQMARYLEDEGIDSYARPLRASVENLNDTFERFRNRVYAARNGGDSGATGTISQLDTRVGADVESALEQFRDDLAVFDSAARDAAREAKANGADAPAARLERVSDHLAEGFEYLDMRVRDHLEGADAPGPAGRSSDDLLRDGTFRLPFTVGGRHPVAVVDEDGSLRCLYVPSEGDTDHVVDVALSSLLGAATEEGE